QRFALPCHHLVGCGNPSARPRVAAAFACARWARDTETRSDRRVALARISQTDWRFEGQWRRLHADICEDGGLACTLFRLRLELREDPCVRELSVGLTLHIGRLWKDDRHNRAVARHMLDLDQSRLLQHPKCVPLST